MERYFITGVQIGLILGALKTKDKKLIYESVGLLDKVQEDQFLGNNPENVTLSDIMRMFEYGKKETK